MDSTKDTAGPASYVDIMEKNHMEIPWHDYAKADSNVLIENAGLKSFCYRQSRTYDALLRHRGMACAHFHEPPVKGTWCYLHGGCRTDVH